MKILFVLGFPNPFAGAGWTRIGFFAENWAGKGHAVEVLGSFSYKTFHKKGAKRMDSINIFNLIFNMSLMHPLIFMLNTLISFTVSTIFLISKKPNVTIVSVPTGDVGLGALMACNLTKTKCIIDYRDRWEDYAISIATTPIEKKFYRIVKKLMMKMYSIFAVTVTVIPANVPYLKRQGIKNVKLISNGADAETFKPSKTRKQNQLFKIIYVGGAFPYYNLGVMINALKILANKGLNHVELFIVGHVPKDLTARLNSDIRNKVNLLGEVNAPEKLSKIIAGSDVGIIPLTKNYIQAKIAWPVKFFEYCACGVPVIATVTEDSRLGELIREHKVGWITPPDNAEELAKIIYWLYKNPSLREVAGKRARKLIEEKFDRNKISEEYLSILKEEVVDPK